MIAAASSSRSSRTLDVLLWGATGFTGKLVAERLASAYGVGGTLRWAIGGRGRDKLEALRAELEAIDPRARGLPIVLGDNRDRASLAAAARDTRVVASTVGPFTVHGRELVAACVDAATDYCDLTGEPQFVRDMIDQHHAPARAKGARIVHCCGFDSIPSDLGTLVVQTYMQEAHGERCSEVKCLVGPFKGGASGGTIASMAQVVEEASRDPRVRHVLMDPYALDPERDEPGPDGRDQLGVRWDRDLRRWTGPFLMAGINTRMVRRTNALLGYAYGRDFRYSEAMGFQSGPKGLVTAAATSVGLAGLLAAAAIKPVRRLLQRSVLPQPGEGPSKEKRASGFFVCSFVGSGETHNGTPRRKVFGTVKGTSDPGYGETAKMLCESAVCLALDGDAIAREGGVLTPAACMGMRLVERLRAAGMTFQATEAI
jgi:short subunit dehydrogenase-like uncharacterized protein